MKIDLNQIRELLAVVSATDITELTLEFGEQKITIKKAPANAVVAGQHAVTEISMPSSAPKEEARALSFEPKAQEPAAALPAPKLEEPISSNNGLVAVTSPMVGTFYRSPSPNAPPFVNVGDHIAVGQTVCIIEAMKLMNDMPAEVSGKVVKVCADNGTTVEYGQTLFLVDPKG